MSWFSVLKSWHTYLFSNPNRILKSRRMRVYFSFLTGVEYALFTSSKVGDIFLENVDFES